ncbi:MAG: RNA 2',3'-cyclic phosphodiesterase [Gammaproteobacteria bacterium]|nr:RNA 2',3'-cyclic phosphodiesterase [Gammaproteobacteria bacterium]
MRSPSNPEHPRRLFLALWPGESERRQLAELAVQAAGRRRVRDANLHLTLVFLGATAPDRLAAYQAALADLPTLELELVLDRYGYWPQPRILWLGSTHTPPELYERVAELHRRLRNCGFVPEQRAFQAHITLARRFTGPIPTKPLKPLYWRIGEVALVESLASAEGSRYEVLRRWPGD